MIGASLANYRITARLGAGGMGEVYRATDLKLDREVAIKVLPKEVASDPERLTRFEREAKLLASLNHPNIAHVYGFEGATLPDGSIVHFLAMEMVEGEDLAERLKRSAIPVDESIAIAKQIAEGLEEAHEHGIIHRDLKPANVKVTPDGKVKVLDFGLAKAMDDKGAASSGSTDLSHSPTMTRQGTEAGIILGTAAYMSPEQARGKKVDKRADIWSFGVLLYEMLAGKRLFEGETVSDVLAGVLKTEIDLASLPAEAPAAVRQLLRRCLERNPKERLHDIADARLMIADALKPGGGADALGLVVSSPKVPAPIARRLPLAASLLLLGAALGFLATRDSARAPDSAAKLNLRRLTDLPGMEQSPDLSPDGKTLVYSSAASGRAHIHVMRIDGGQAIDITPGVSSDDEQPAFSPDGQQIAFRSSRDGGGLFVMGATGESVRRVTDEGFDPAWSPDGRRIAYSMEATHDPYGRSTDAALWVVEVATGEKRRLPPRDGVQPAWSPDGKWIAYWANDGGQRDLWTIAADGGPPVAVTHDAETDWSPEWSPDGHWLYFSSDRAGGLNIFRVLIDPSTGGPAGEPEPVTTSTGNLGWARFSADGRRMVAAAYELSAVLDLYGLTPGPEPKARLLRTLRPRTLHWCRLSPDAVWIACSTIGTPEDLALLRADGSELRRLTNDAFKARNGNWSFDGSRILFQSTRSGPWAFWIVRSDGSELRQVFDDPRIGNQAAWRPHGERITFMFDGDLAELDPSRLTLPSELRGTPLPASMQGFNASAWSPSGKLLGGTEINQANQSLSAGAIDPEKGVYLKSRLPTKGYSFLAFAGWLPDSRRFVALGADSVALVDVESGNFKPLLPVSNPLYTYVSLSRDGGTLLVEKPIEDGDIWLLENRADKAPGK